MDHTCTLCVCVYVCMRVYVSIYTYKESNTGLQAADDHTMNPAFERITPVQCVRACVYVYIHVCLLYVYGCIHIYMWRVRHRSKRRWRPHHVACCWIAPAHCVYSCMLVYMYVYVYTNEELTTNVCIYIQLKSQTCIHVQVVNPTPCSLLMNGQFLDLWAIWRFMGHLKVSRNCVTYSMMITIHIYVSFCMCTYCIYMCVVYACVCITIHAECMYVYSACMMVQTC